MACGEETRFWMTFLQTTDTVHEIQAEPWNLVDDFGWSIQDTERVDSRFVFRSLWPDPASLPCRPRGFCAGGPSHSKTPRKRQEGSIRKPFKGETWDYAPSTLAHIILRILSGVVTCCDKLVVKRI